MEVYYNSAMEKIDTSYIEEIKNTLNGKLLLGVDFQGWPVVGRTLREILERIGFKESNGKLELELNDSSEKLLNSYPRLLEDDGMGYGVDEEFITVVDNDVYETEVGGENISVFNVFREKYFLDKV